MSSSVFRSGVAGMEVGLIDHFHVRCIETFAKPGFEDVLHDDCFLAFIDVLGFLLLLLIVMLVLGAPSSILG